MPHTAAMSTPDPGVHLNHLLQHAAEGAGSAGGDPVADGADGALHAPEGTRCAECGAPLLPQQGTRRGPAGLRHESCP